MISKQEIREITWNGIWKQNTSIVQILGMCPLLAVTTNLVNGAMLSLATILVMAMSGFAIASLRNLIPHEIRIPVFILIVAALVTVVDLLFNANFHELYLILGIFIPLIVTNCIVVGRAEAFAAKKGPALSALVCEHLRACGYSVEYNHPYKGVELVRRYGNPAQHRHSIQVEINRKLYMDETTLAQHPEGMARLQADLQALAKAFHVEPLDLGNEDREARFIHQPCTGPRALAGPDRRPQLGTGTPARRDHPGIEQAQAEAALDDRAVPPG